MQVYRGSRDDLIARFAGAAATHELDAIIQVDGDDLLADVAYMDVNMQRLLADDGIDVVLNRGLPLGVASKAIRASALRHIAERYIPSPNGTSWSVYLTTSELCRRAYVDPLRDDHRHDRVRLTLDYPQDLSLFRAIFDDFYSPGTAFGLEDVLALLRRRPELVELNAGLEETYAARTELLVDLERPKYRRDDGTIAELTPA